MEDYLKSAKDRFYLTLGKYELSPIIQVSTAIALDYSKETENSDDIQPFFMTFPNKDSTSLWISIQYLVNLFIYDYIYQSENRIKELGLNSGDKIDIFSTCAIFKRFDSEANKVVLLFSDDAEAQLTIQNIQFINLSNKKMLNKYRLYKKNQKKFLGNRRALTQILNLDQNPNFGALNSKVMLITGRGKAGLFRDQLKKTFVYDEPLSEVVLLDKNLLISPDFSSFSFSTNPDSYNNTIYFEKSFKRIISSIVSEELEIKEIIKKCVLEFENSFKTKEFLDCYQTLCSRLSLDSKNQAYTIKLKTLLKYHPGIENDITSNISAVFVNDIQLMLDNQSTIQYLLSHHIPIFVISDRVVSEFNDSDIYSKIFDSETYRKSFRFNWDKNKINKIKIEVDREKKYLDHKINKLLCRYYNQKISIEILPLNEFDAIFNSIETRIYFSSLDDHEILQKSYYQTLRPLLYAIKNSVERPNTNKLINSLDVFIECFESSSSGLDVELKSSINDSIARIKAYILSGDQPKEYIEKKDGFFYQEINVHNKIFTIPIESEDQDYIHRNEVNSEFPYITFVGYPYREYSFKFIDESIFKKIVPSVELILSQCEAGVTINNLKRKIKSGYYIEKYPVCIDELNVFRVSKEEQITALIDDTFTVSEKNIDKKEAEFESTTQFKELEQILNEYRYAGHEGSKVDNESDGQYLLNSNVLHFDNGSYVFLPHKWRILTIKESVTGPVETLRCRIDELSVGDVAIIVNVSRESITKYLERSYSMQSHMKKLDSWRDLLKDYKNQYGDISKLVSELERINHQMKIGGSAERYNVLRWLHDEMMLAPTYENLKMVLGLKFEKDKLSDMAKSILSARAAVLKAKNKLDRLIEEKITIMIGDSHNSLEDNFTLQILGIEVNGMKNQIIGIEKRSDLKIEYNSTMKFFD